MVQAAAGSPLLERSHIMVSEPRHSSPCQREAAHTRPSRRMTVMSWRVSGRTRDPRSWLKHSGNEHISNSCLSHGRAGMVGLWFLLNLPTCSLLCTPGSSYSWCWALSFAWKEGDSMEGTAGAGRVQFVSRVKFLIPWGVRFRDLWLKRVIGGQKPKKRSQKGGREGTRYLPGHWELGFWSPAAWVQLLVLSFFLVPLPWESHSTSPSFSCPIP